MAGKAVWFHAQDGQSSDPLTLEELAARLDSLAGGEGLFLATLTGPGRIWLQSLPFSRLAGRVYAAAPQTGGKRKGEGSILGGLGNLLDGD